MPTFVADILKVLSFIPGVVTFLNSIGVQTGQIGADAVQISSLTETDVANYEAGQAVPVGSIKGVEGNDPGVLILCKLNGPAYHSLFG